jgi:hypothetical protein
MKSESVDCRISEKFRCSVDEATGEYAFVSNQQRSPKSKAPRVGTQLIERPFAED